MSDQVDWADNPPSVPVANLWKPPNGKSYCIVLGRWHAAWVHWMGLRTLPCYGEKCPKARHIKPAHWFGYLPVLIRDKTENNGQVAKYTQLAVLPVGREIGNQLKGELNGTLPFGMALYRKNDSRVFTVAEIMRDLKEPNLPAAFDVRPTLWRVWGIRPEEESAQE